VYPEKSEANIQILRIFSCYFEMLTSALALTYGGKGLQGSSLIIEKLAKTIPNSKIEFHAEGEIRHTSLVR